MRTVYDSIADLALCYPNVQLNEGNVKGMASMLQDIDTVELDRAAAVHVRRSRFFPSVSELRAIVFTQQLGLPNEEEAWQTVTQLATMQLFTDCPECSGSGMVGDLETREAAPPLPDGIDGPFAEFLAAVAERGLLVAADICPRCDGSGEIRNPDRPRLTEEVAQALQHIGGIYAIKTSDNIAVLRAQFLKSYARVTERQTEQADLLSLGAGPGLGELGRGAV